MPCMQYPIYKYHLGTPIATWRSSQTVFGAGPSAIALRIPLRSNGPLLVLLYADDLVLLAPSWKAMQLLLNICVYVTSLDMKFNASKSVSIILHWRQSVLILQSLDRLLMFLKLRFMFMFVFVVRVHLVLVKTFSSKFLKFALWWGCSQNGWTDFDAQYVIRRRLVRVRPFSKNEIYRSKTLTLKRSKSAILFDTENFDPNFLENGTR